MRKITGLLLALVMAFSMMSMVTPTASADEPTVCTAVKTRTQWTEGMRSKQRIRIYYRVCAGGSGGKWTKVISASGRWHHERRNLTCGWQQPFEGARWTLTVRDNRGVTKTRVFSVGCRESGSATVSVRLSGWPKLYHVRGVPRYNVKTTEMWSYGMPDHHMQTSGTLF